MSWPTTSRHERGYGSEWSRTRLRILKRDRGVCQPCLKDGRIHGATHVDHIVSKAEGMARGWTKAQIEADSNLQAINAECHKHKTTEDQGGRVRGGIPIGKDGWPI